MEKEQVEQKLSEVMRKEYEDTKESIAVKDWANSQNYKDIIVSISKFIEEKKRELMVAIRANGERKAQYSEMERLLWIADYYRAVAHLIDESEGGKLVKSHLKSQAERQVRILQTSRDFTDFHCYTSLDKIKSEIMIAMTLFVPGGISDDLAETISPDKHHFRDATIAAYQKAKVEKTNQTNPYDSESGTPE
jgi:hypothetical protein